MTPQDVALFIYNLTLLPIVFFSVLFMMLAMLNLLLGRKKEEIFKELEELPFITVQIPTYNDPVAERCIRHCLEFNYPKDKYEIIIADDSTNIETQNILARFEEQNPGFIKYVHRNNRQNFKAGALNMQKGSLLLYSTLTGCPARIS